MNKFQLARTRGAYKVTRAYVLVEKILEEMFERYLIRKRRRKEEGREKRETERKKKGEKKIYRRNTRTAAGDERFVRISTIHVIVNNVT